MKTTTHERPPCFNRPRETWTRYDYAAIRRFNNLRQQAKQERTRDAVTELRDLFMKE
jgi:hypothetical protein